MITICFYLHSRLSRSTVLSLHSLDLIWLLINFHVLIFEFVFFYLFWSNDDNQEQLSEYVVLKKSKRYFYLTFRELEEIEHELKFDFDFVA